MANTPQCAGCGLQADPGHDKAGFPVATPDGWYWLTKLRGAGRWYFCSLACVAAWSAVERQLAIAVRPELRELLPPLWER